jgi:cellulose synthase/poly-beta-1,6-N-acetylglucosamine synthase-like glycosyltransferase
LATPRLSVIIPAYLAQATLPRVLGALGSQLPTNGSEVIVVHNGSREVPHTPEWVRVVRAEHRLFPGQARNLGVSHSSGELLVFLDADAVPEPGWLDGLLRSLRPDIDAVCGAVLNGTTESWWGTAGYLLEFLEWVPQREGPLEHAVACNLLVRRSTFAQLGGFAEDMRAAEDTVLTAPLARQGSLAFAPGARVKHLNRVCVPAVLVNQLRLGTAWGQACTRVSLPADELTTPWLAPVAVASRLWAIVRHSHRYGASGEVARHLPAILAGLTAWGVGLWRYASGRVRGPGGAARQPER